MPAHTPEIRQGPLKRRLGASLLASAVMAAVLLAPLFPASAAAPTSYLLTREGSTYRATPQGGGTTYTGTLKHVMESAARDLNGGGGGTIAFATGVFDFGSEYFKGENLSNITLHGQGMDVTVVQNNSSASADTEPFNMGSANQITVRDMTVIAGGPARSTSDALDFDGGNDVVIERLKVAGSRGRGIVFDGKDIVGGATRTADRNVIRDCVITGVSSDGIELLASSDNRIEGCTITDTGGHGIQIAKASTGADQPNKKSNDNQLSGNSIDNAGQDGINLTSGDRNEIVGNNILNSSDDTSGRDGIRLSSSDSIDCGDNIVSSNTSGDNQATHTQKYGLNISSSRCNRTVVWQNTFFGNRSGAIRDLGTDTRYTAPPASDTQAPTTPGTLTATAVSSTRVNLSWGASTDNVGVTGYEIFRDGSLHTTVGVVTSYSDTTVSPSTAYSYQVRAKDAAGNHSGFSNTATATTPAPPDTQAPTTPGTLTATAVSATRVDLSWGASTDNVGVTGYEILRNGSLHTTVGAVTSYSDTTVSPSTTYSYQVRARDAAGNLSAFSNTATATTPAPPPSALFSDGFETGNFANWTSNTGLVAQQQEVFAGSWAARGTTTSAATWAYKTLGTTQTQLYYRIRFKVISQGASSTVNVLKLRTATGTALFGLFRNTSGNLGYRNEVAAVSTNSTTPISLGTWHEVQIRVRINGASGEAETWFDGVRIASLSKIENFGTTPIGRLQIGENSTGRTYDFAFDTVTASTSFIGP